MATFTIKFKKTVVCVVDVDATDGSAARAKFKDDDGTCLDEAQEVDLVDVEIVSVKERA